MKLPSEWRADLATELAPFSDMRAVAHAAMDGFDVTRFDREIQALLEQLAGNAACGDRLAEEVDLFGNAHWYNYGAFNAEVAELAPSAYAVFVRAKFAEHCEEKFAAELAGLDEAAWKTIVAMHFVYMLFSLYDKARCRDDFGLVMTGRRKLRCATNPLLKLLSRLL